MSQRWTTSDSASGRKVIAAEQVAYDDSHFCPAFDRSMLSQREIRYRKVRDLFAQKG